jgi:hypothetical protein
MNFTISGLTLENGRSDFGGGIAINNLNGNVLITKSVIQDNQALGTNAVAAGGSGGNAFGGGIATKILI